MPTPKEPKKAPETKDSIYSSSKCSLQKSARRVVDRCFKAKVASVGDSRIINKLKQVMSQMSEVSSIQQGSSRQQETVQTITNNLVLAIQTAKEKYSATPE